MADQDPYDYGAEWLHMTTNETVHILAVFEDTARLVPGRQDEDDHAYVVFTSRRHEPDVCSVDAFLLWYTRPDGSLPRPKPFIPQQQDNQTRRTA